MASSTLIWSWFVCYAKISLLRQKKSKGSFSFERRESCFVPKTEFICRWRKFRNINSLRGTPFIASFSGPTCDVIYCTLNSLIAQIDISQKMWEWLKHYGESWERTHNHNQHVIFTVHLLIEKLNISIQMLMNVSLFRVLSFMWIALRIQNNVKNMFEWMNEW